MRHGSGGEGGFLDLYSFSSMGLFIIVEKKTTKKPEQNQNKQKSKEINKQKKQNKNQTAVIKFWNKNEGYIEMLVICCC